MSDTSLNDRLKHFEENQLSVGDKYGAEVLYRARMSIDALVRYINAMRYMGNEQEKSDAYEALSEELKDLIGG